MFTAAVEHHADEERMTEALAAFHEALRPASELPRPSSGDGPCAGAEAQRQADAGHCAVRTAGATV
ncbi:hypothetical protein OQI_17090 [Streptomyces pharetrae CZA14]|uniref:Uncharacterized protein n=1 Tax=Streptomyces pharetrae CZA14 TaxID=1144883 RepID=A0ABX3YJ90_9ACTN|nr:hypothetical protein OQI_17090 [Streptomyces pharetrae CZA14]